MSKISDSLVELKEIVSQTLSVCLTECNFQPPLFMACVGVNGTLFFFRYDSTPDGNLSTTCLAKHIDGDGFVVPINCMVVDSMGEAARLLIGSKGVTEFKPFH